MRYWLRSIAPGGDRRFLFKFQEGFLAVNTPCITGKAASRADNPVAGYEQGDWIMSNGPAYCPGG